MSIHLPTPETTEPERREIEISICKLLYGQEIFEKKQTNSYNMSATNSLIRAFRPFENEEDARAFMTLWLKVTYQTETQFGNFVTIRDVRRKVGSLAWPKWRVSLYYRTQWLERPKWRTIKSTSLAEAITMSVIQALVDNTVVTVSMLEEQVKAEQERR